MEKKLYFSFTDTQKIFNKIAQIDQCKEKWLTIKGNENQYLKELRRESLIASTQASIRFHGAARSTHDIQKILNTTQTATIQSQEEKEIYRYYHVLESIITGYHKENFDEPLIFHLHTLLFRSRKDASEHGGTYKNHPYKVVAQYPNGQKRVIVTNRPLFSIKIEMYELFKWTHHAFKDMKIHPLLVIALFMYEFLCIQPFDAGNGHISRLIITFLMLKHEYSYFQYVSFEELIEKRKYEYQYVLKECQKERGKEKNEIIDKWVFFFIDCMFDLTIQFEEKINHMKSLGSYLNERQKGVLTIIREKQPVRLADINNLLKNISINTIRKDLKYLTHEGILKKWGKNKGTVYSMNMNKFTKEVVY